MSRWKAAAIHLAISALVIATIAALVLWLWYPPALLGMSGVDQLIGIIAGVDLVAGPMLTLIVYKAGKKSLRTDLTIIGMVQLALMLYGLNTLAAVRPVFIVGVLDRFQLVTANEIDPEELARGNAPFNRLSWTGPQYVGAIVPTDPVERSALTKREMSGQEIHTLPSYYVPFDHVRADLLKHAMEVAALMQRADTAASEHLRKAIGGRSPDTLRYLPVVGSRGDAMMLMDASSGAPLRPVAADPWK